MIKENPTMIGDSVEAYLKQIHAEAAYFGLDNGERTFYIVLDLPSADMMPVIAEPLFVNMGARISIKPVMNIEQLKSGLAKVVLK